MSVLPPPEALYSNPEAAFTAIQLHAKGPAFIGTGSPQLTQPTAPTYAAFTLQSATRY